MAQHWRRQAMRSPANSERAARARLLEIHPEGGKKPVWIDAYLADILTAQGKRAEARTQRALALTKFRETFGDAHPLTRSMKNALKAMD